MGPSSSVDWLMRLGHCNDRKREVHGNHETRRQGPIVILLVAPIGLAPVLRQASSIKAGTARASVEFPSGVKSVRQLEAPELSKMAEAGYPLPAAARARVVTYRAVQAVKRQEAARIAKRRERVAEKAQAVRDGKGEAAERVKRKARDAAMIERKAAARRRKAQGKPSEEASPATLPLPLESSWDGASAPW